MKPELKNKLKIAAGAVVLLIGMVVYKLIYDKRAVKETPEKDEEE